MNHVQKLIDGAAPARHIDRLVGVYDTIKGAHYSVRLRIDTEALAVALAKKALRSKGKRTRLVSGAIEVKINV